MRYHAVEDALPMRYVTRICRDALLNDLIGKLIG